MNIGFRAITALLLLCNVLTAFGRLPADSVRFYGHAPDYAGMNLVFERQSNFITRDIEEVVRIRVDAKGDFNISFASDITAECYADLGQLRGTLYFEPGKEYQLVLPPYAPKPIAERFNPYFVPDEVELGIAAGDPSKLNRQISEFDQRFDDAFNANAIEIFAKADVARTKLLVSQLDSVFPASKNSYFENHKQARYAKLYNLAYKRQKRLAISYFADHVRIDFNQPAYTESFNEIFKDFFLNYFAAPSGKNLKEAFTQNKSFDTLSMALGQDTLFRNPTFRESILLKSLYDAYYSDRYNKEQIEKAVSAAITQGATPTIKEMAKDIARRFQKLKKGTSAPNFEAVSSSGKTYTLDSFKGKFVYLNFVHTQNYACKKDLLTLSAIAKEYKKDLEVVTVMTDEDQDAAFAFAKQNNLKYNILHYAGNGKVLMDYNIRSMPMYYLIDPEGNIALSPAPAPDESFGKVFLESLKSFKYTKAKKSPETNRSIYDL